MVLDDIKLIKKSLEGEDNAFEKLLEKYLSPVFNFLFQLTRNRADAEDLAQETFIKAWKNLHKFNPQKSYKSRLNRKNRNLASYQTKGSGSGFKTWLFTIAKNTAFDWLKKKKELPFSNFADDDGYSPFEKIKDEEILPDEILERKSLTEELERALEKIPPHYRAILLLHYKEDFSLHEISQVLDKSYNTVKSRHRRGLKRLEQALLE